MVHFPFYTKKSRACRNLQALDFTGFLRVEVAGFELFSKYLCVIARINVCAKPMQNKELQFYLCLFFSFVMLR